MTRDEAAMAFESVGGSSFSGHAFVDRFVAIGILKLDEPMSAENKALGALVNRCRMDNSHGGDCVPFSKSEAARIIELLNVAGLKIVEK